MAFWTMAAKLRKESKDSVDDVRHVQLTRIYRN
jgi:hypothetical protein